VGLVLWRLRPSRGTPPALAPDSNRRPPGMNRAEWRALLWERRVAWRTPRLDTLERPALSLPRRMGLLTIRGYILFAIVIVVIKLVQVATAH